MYARMLYICMHASVYTQAGIQMRTFCQYGVCVLCQEYLCIRMYDIVEACKY
jgi:hypothetical protein